MNLDCFAIFVVSVQIGRIDCWCFLVIGFSLIVGEWSFLVCFKCGVCGFGVVTNASVLESSTNHLYSVYFHSSCEQIDFSPKEIWLHREWLDQ